VAYALDNMAWAEVYNGEYERAASLAKEAAHFEQLTEPA
jgi:hypothetical protein